MLQFVNNIPHYKLHVEGYFHINKLPEALWKPYCVGFDLAKLLFKGLIGISKPAKHFESAINQILRFIDLASRERGDAIAINF